MTTLDLITLALHVLTLGATCANLYLFIWFKRHTRIEAAKDGQPASLLVLPPSTVDAVTRDERIASAVRDAYDLAEQMAASNARSGHKVTWVDKQNVAFKHAAQRLAAERIEVDARLLAQRIEVEVARRKRGTEPEEVAAPTPSSTSA